MTGVSSPRDVLRLAASPLRRGVFTRDEFRDLYAALHLNPCITEAAARCALDLLAILGTRELARALAHAGGCATAWLSYEGTAAACDTVRPALEVLETLLMVDFEDERLSPEPIARSHGHAMHGFLLSLTQRERSLFFREFPRLSCGGSA